VGDRLKTLAGVKRKWTAWTATLFFCAFATSVHANHVHMHGGPFIGVVLSVIVDPTDTKNVYCASYGGGVFRSENGGATWAAINQGLPDRQVYTLLMHPTDTGHIYVGTDQGVFHSLDRGSSWRSLTPILAERNIRAVAVDPKEPKRLYVATDQGVFVGQEGHWKNPSEGIASKDVRTVVVSPEGKVYAGTFSGVFAMGKGAGAWVPVNGGLTDRQVRALAFDPSSPDTLYAGTASGGVFKTTDAGNRWVAVNRGLANKMVLSVAVVPSRPSTLYAGTIGGVFKSLNGGAKWIAAGSELPLTVSTLALDPAGLDLIYAGSGGRVYKSINAGQKWTEVGHHINHFGPVGPAVH